MTTRFPELTSFGTLLTFAHSLEEAAAEIAGLAMERGACATLREDLEDLMKRHKKRSEMVQRIRRERLNEVVLQPIYGMERDRYVLRTDLLSDCQDSENAMDALASVEETVSSFYEDAANYAENVLSGVERTFRKLARESATRAQMLRGKRSLGL